jgi:hypothetical protein
MRTRSYILIVSLCVMGGCSKGPRTYPVEGRVTFRDGKPLTGGTVEFQPVGELKGQISARGYIATDGTYHMSTFEQADGVMEGKHRVLVISPFPPGPIDPTKPPKPLIHDRFQHYDTSGLEFDVNPSGDNRFDITVDPP